MYLINIKAKNKKTNNYYQLKLNRSYCTFRNVYYIFDKNELKLATLVACLELLYLIEYLLNI